LVVCSWVFLYCVFALCGFNFFFENLFNFLKNAVF